MQLAMHMVTIEDLMPREHFLRKLEAALDLSFVYEETAPLYNKKYGRPAIDPVVIVKYLLVGFLYGIPSERQIERRVQTSPCAGTWASTSSTGCRITAPSHSCAAGNRPSARCFGGYLKKSWGSASKKVWSAGAWWGRTRPM